MTRARELADYGYVESVGDNLLINGDMSIWQRGTSFAAGHQDFTADRWKLSGVTRSAQKSVQVPNAEFSSSINVNDSAIVSKIRTTIELQEVGKSAPFVNGGVYTLSFWIRNLSGSGLASIYIAYTDGSTAANSVTILNAAVGYTEINTDWKYVTCTFTIDVNPVGTNNSLLLEIGTTSTANGFYLTGVKLEKGSQATPFVTASRAGIGGELALCQRYYHRLANDNSVATYTAVGAGFWYSATTPYAVYKFPVVMRAAPSFAHSGTTNGFRFMEVSGFTELSSVGGQNASPVSIELWSGSGTGTAGDGTWLRLLNNSYIAFDAEL